MKMRRYPERTCVGCGTRRQKRELMRLVLDQGELAIDESGKQAGRGTYLCRELESEKPLIRAECFEQAKQKRAFAHTFKQMVKIGDSFLDYVSKKIPATG